MSDLIEKLEKATEADRELDGLIYGLLNSLKRNDGTFLMDIDGEKFQFEHPTERHPNGPAALYVSGHRVFDFTGSIDAAITLLPLAFWGSIEWAGVLNGSDRQWPLVTVGSGDQKIKAQGKTVPLTICIAALRARDAMAG